MFSPRQQTAQKIELWLYVDSLCYLVELCVNIVRAVAYNFDQALILNGRRFTNCSVVIVSAIYVVVSSLVLYSGAEMSKKYIFSSRGEFCNGMFLHVAL